MRDIFLGYRTLSFVGGEGTGTLGSTGFELLVQDAAGRGWGDVVVGCVPGFISWWLLCGVILDQHLVRWCAGSWPYELWGWVQRA